MEILASWGINRIVNVTTYGPDKLQAETTFLSYKITRDLRRKLWPMDQ